MSFRDHAPFTWRVLTNGQDGGLATYTALRDCLPYVVETRYRQVFQRCRTAKGAREACELYNLQAAKEIMTDRSPSFPVRLIDV
jgi:hypothetical protein